MVKMHPLTCVLDSAPVHAVKGLGAVKDRAEIVKIALQWRKGEFLQDALVDLAPGKCEQIARREKSRSLLSKKPFKEADQVLVEDLEGLVEDEVVDFVHV